LEEENMKVLGNATALFAAILIMVALLVAQHGYQNSWHEPTQTSAATLANGAMVEGTGGYKVVMK
jgi:hypothetical protein